MSDPWYRRMAAVVLPGALGARFAPPAAQKEPTTKQLQSALAYVDPSRLISGWVQAPYNPGWLVTRKGLGIYDTMKRDEQVKAALKFKKSSVLASGWEVVSPGDQEEDWEVTQFVRNTLLGVQGGWHAVLTDILGALEYGYSVGERVYGEAEKGNWKGKVVLSRLQSIKPHYIDFVVDEFGVLHGITQQMAGLAQQDLPIGKFVIYTHQKEFGNFYGISDLESAYRPWWTKDNAYKWLAVTLERFGLPPLFAMYDPNSYQGNQIEELKKVVARIQNATLGVIPRATKDALEFWSQQLGKGSVDLFLQSLDRFDQHIARAVLVPSMIGVASDEGNNGSLARSQTHADSFLRVVAELQQDIAVGVVNAQIIPQLCDLNFPGLDEYPIFRFLPYTDEQRLEVIKTWSELVGGKVVGRIEDDERHIRKVIGFPENDDIKIEALPEQPPPGQFPPGKPAFGKKPPPFGKPKLPDKKELSMEEVPEEEQSEEMRTFAEENNAVWVYADDGGKVAVSADSVFELCKDCSGSTAPTCRKNRKCLGTP